MSYLAVLGLLGLAYFAPELWALSRGRPEAAAEIRESILYRLAEPLTQRLLYRPAAQREAKARERRLLLDQAGLRAMSLEAFRARQQATCLLGMAGAALLSLFIGANPALALGFVAGAGMVGYLQPDMAVRRRAEARKRAIYVSLPFFAAQLANRIMATGKRLSDAMRAVSEEGQGPLYEEVAHAFRLIDLKGYPFARAITHVARATGVQAVVDLFNVLVYAEERTGGGLVELLTQASKGASRDLRHSLESAKGRAVIRGTALATIFEIPAILMAVLFPLFAMLLFRMEGVQWF